MGTKGVPLGYLGFSRVFGGKSCPYARPPQHLWCWGTDCYGRTGAARCQPNVCIRYGRTNAPFLTERVQPILNSYSSKLLYIPQDSLPENMNNFDNWEFQNLNNYNEWIKFFKEDSLKSCIDFRIVSEILFRQLWFDCTWFCKMLYRTRERALYLGKPASIISYAL